MMFQGQFDQFGGFGSLDIWRPVHLLELSDVIRQAIAFAAFVVPDGGTVSAVQVYADAGLAANFSAPDGYTVQSPVLRVLVRGVDDAAFEEVNEATHQVQPGDVIRIEVDVTATQAGEADLTRTFAISGAGPAIAPPEDLWTFGNFTENSFEILTRPPELPPVTSMTADGTTITITVGA